MGTSSGDDDACQQFDGCGVPDNVDPFADMGDFGTAFTNWDPINDFGSSNSGDFLAGPDGGGESTQGTSIIKRDWWIPSDGCQMSDPLCAMMFQQLTGSLNLSGGSAPRARTAMSRAVPRQQQQFDYCLDPALWAGLKAAVRDAIPLPPQYDPSPVNGTGNLLSSKQGQAAMIYVLNDMAKGARLLSPAADAAADVVPFVGWAWGGGQAVHALFEGVQGAKASYNSCHGGS